MAFLYEQGVYGLCSLTPLVLIPHSLKSHLSSSSEVGVASLVFTLSLWLKVILKSAFDESSTNKEKEQNIERRAPSQEGSGMPSLESMLSEIFESGQSDFSPESEAWGSAHWPLPKEGPEETLATVPPQGLLQPGLVGLLLEAWPLPSRADSRNKY